MRKKTKHISLFGKKKAQTVVEDIPDAIEMVVEEEERGRKPRKRRKEKEPGMFKMRVGDFFKLKLVQGMLIIATSILIGFVAVPSWQEYRAQRVPVVVVTQPVAKGEMITREKITLGEIGQIDKPREALESVEQAVGAYAAADLFPDDYITVSKVSAEIPFENDYLYHLPPGKSAISVNVAGLAEGLSGKLKNGDIVSIYAAFNTMDATENYYALQPSELKYVKVLAVSNTYGNDVDIESRKGDETDRNLNLPATITLLVNDRQAAALAGLDRNSTIYAALVSRDNEAFELLCLEAQDEYFRKLEDEEDEEKELVKLPGPPTEEEDADGEPPEEGGEA